MQASYPLMYSHCLQKVHAKNECHAETRSRMQFAHFAWHLETRTSYFRSTRGININWLRLLCFPLMPTFLAWVIIWSFLSQVCPVEPAPLLHFEWSSAWQMLLNSKLSCQCCYQLSRRIHSYVTPSLKSHQLVRYCKHFLRVSKCTITLLFQIPHLSLFHTQKGTGVFHQHHPTERCAEEIVTQGQRYFRLGNY